MDEIIIHGGRALAGTVEVSGAKNAALPILFASLLTPEICRLDNVPKVADCRTARHLLERLGVELVELEGGGSRLALCASPVSSVEAPYDLVKTMRASFLALAPLLARFGVARVATPGGCAIGSRPVNLHLAGLVQMGADIRQSHGYVHAEAPAAGEARSRLRAAHISLDFPSVGATENLMLAAALAHGRTIIENAAREPEVVDLANVIEAMGAPVCGAGTSVIEITGQEELDGFTHRIIPDRIEAGTFLIAGAATGGDVEVIGARPGHLGALLEKLAEAGVEMEAAPERVRVRSKGPLRAFAARTAPFPGFPTDLQAQLVALACRARGQSRITETIFENRFMHVDELARLGADISVEGSSAIVNGVASLEGAEVMATDLRASVSLVIAGLMAENTTRLQRVYHLDRGYERLTEKLVGLGADVARVSGPMATFAHAGSVAAPPADGATPGQAGDGTEPGAPHAEVRS